MPRSKIQFQKGLSERQFRESYGTEEQCRAALFVWRWPQGFVCPRCGGGRCCEIKTRKLIQCSACRHQVSVTAGTIFQSTKLQLIVWFQAIYLLTQTKKGISSLELGRRLGVTQTTAWKVQQKLAQVMRDREAARPVGGPDKRVEMDDAYLGGKRRGGKRGRGAAAKTPIVVAVETSAESHPLRLKLTAVKGFRKAEIRKLSARALVPGTRVISDGLSCFAAVTQAGCQHEPILTGSGARAVQIPAFKWVNTTIGNIKNAIRGTHHAIRPRHVPRYLAQFEYRFNRRYRLEDMIPRLAWAALRSPPMPYRLLKSAEFSA
jgi:hypothetical protein